MGDIFYLFDRDCLETNDEKIIYKQVINRNDFEEFKLICNTRYNFIYALNAIYGYCCFKNRLVMLLWLEQNKNIKPEYWAVDSAASAGHLDLVKYFHERNIKGFNALFFAIMGNDLKMVEYLYDCGYRHDQEECLDWANRKGFKELFNWMKKQGWSYEHEL